jgi:hypothetical protein
MVRKRGPNSVFKMLIKHDGVCHGTIRNRKEIRLIILQAPILFRIAHCILPELRRRVSFRFFDDGLWEVLPDRSDRGELRDADRSLFP